ncbi:MAG: DsrE family protein [Verrucomicrobiales bacterium]|nr:DsrE family protein [Verrucomicrobiales bacterium]MCP5527121.1 DsrE family protein [Verrucomicrobiales bacterium]
MSQLAGKKLGILVSVGSTAAGFAHAVGLATAAIEAGVDTYVYCIDEAVTAIAEPGLQALRPRGLRLYACAYGAQRRGIPLSEEATFAGLTVVSDLMSATDRFVSFN